jgi:hypothetical protein
MMHIKGFDGAAEVKTFHNTTSIEDFLHLLAMPLLKNLLKGLPGLLVEYQGELDALDSALDRV